MTLLSISRWAEDYQLFALGALSFVAATIGRMARRRRWPSWARVHLAGMGASYILLITAFYVDNGPNLPLWRELPQIAFWMSELNRRRPKVIPIQSPRESYLLKPFAEQIGGPA